MANQYTKKTALASDAFPMMSKADIKAKSQPHFTLLAKDNFTPQLVRDWIVFAEASGTPQPKIAEAKRLLDRIEEWRRLNPMSCKTPD